MGKLTKRYTKKCRCGKVFFVTISKMNRKYCSFKCYTNNNQGRNHWEWKDKTFDKDGYILIMKKDHPFANPNGYVREHRLVMEEKIGRYLLPNEVVHHINHIRSDNRIENLALLSSQSEHLKLEWKNKERKMLRWNNL